MSIEEKFYAGVKVIQSLPKDASPYQPSNTTKLKFYSLFKQATDGPCKQAKPNFWDVVGRVKWEAWNKLGDMDKEQAMNQYVDELKKVTLNQAKIVETMSFNGDVQEFLDSIGPFYEFINLQGQEMQHIKDEIDQFTSSSSASSSSNSALGSPINSTPNSPLISRTEHDDIVKDDTKETVLSTKPVSQTNGYLPHQGEKLVQASSHEATTTNDSKYENISSSIIPPPAPTHSHKKPVANGHAKFSAQVTAEENEKDDEILEVQQNHLENEEITTGNFRRQKLSSKLSVETTGSGDSEKYYSGDSEPEFDERYNTGGATGNNTGSSGYQSYDDTTRGHLLTTTLHGSYRKVNENVVTRVYSGSDHMTATSSSYMDIAHRSTDGELVLQATVDRLNRDVDHILARLRILEAAYASNADTNIAERNGAVRRRRRIFGELSTPALVLIFTWPFAAHFLIKLIRWWIRRRRTGTLALTATN